MASRRVGCGRALAAGVAAALLCAGVGPPSAQAASGPAAGTGTVGTIGTVAVAAVAPMLQRLEAAAGSVVASRLEPGGRPTEGRTDWTPPTDLRVPSLPPTPGTAGGRALTKYEVVGNAYASAVTRLGARCHLPYMLLAAVNEVESSSLRGRSLDARHRVVPPVIGPALSGGRFAAIRDTDGGRLDGDPVWDRAVGPMQFIPATWRVWGADGNGDGVADPQNVEDAVLAAGRYLCAGGRDLSRRADMEAAILSYNHSRRYLDTVLGLYDAVTAGLVAGP
ncbi:lytic transglycosylase domain-containing protein [Terrabacter sp. NPDC000476]|uniref:lytic transglycosylase domain-containing protein n=1 Tax=Terrabacter sp. NPDC000476 TaxID=3154258 RepID=UPI003318881C